MFSFSIRPCIFALSQIRQEQALPNLWLFHLHASTGLQQSKLLHEWAIAALVFLLFFIHFLYLQIFIRSSHCFELAWARILGINMKLCIFVQPAMSVGTSPISQVLFGARVRSLPTQLLGRDALAQVDLGRGLILRFVNAWFWYDCPSFPGIDLADLVVDIFGHRCHLLRRLISDMILRNIHLLLFLLPLLQDPVWWCRYQALNRSGSPQSWSGALLGSCRTWALFLVWDRCGIQDLLLLLAMCWCIFGKFLVDSLNSWLIRQNALRLGVSFISFRIVAEFQLFFLVLHWILLLELEGIEWSSISRFLFFTSLSHLPGSCSRILHSSLGDYLPLRLSSRILRHLLGLSLTIIGRLFSGIQWWHFHLLHLCFIEFVINFLFQFWFQLFLYWVAWISFGSQWSATAFIMFLCHLWGAFLLCLLLGYNTL